jgi:hypothetical protein
MELESKKNTRLESLIVLFIYLSIFINSYVFIKKPFELYFGYLIFIILLPIFISRYGYKRELVTLFAILLLNGVFQILIGNNTSILFFKVFIGLILSYFFYYYVLIEFNKNIEKLFTWYLIGSFYVSIIGIVQFISFQVGFRPGYNFNWILNKWSYAPGGLFGLRINSIFAEPTHLGAVLSPAFFISIYNLFINEPFGITRRQSLVIIIVYFLSFSGLGQLGIFLTLIFFAINFGLLRYLILVIPVSLFLFNFLYNNVIDFRDRYDSLVGLFSGNQKFQLGKTHGSSFILYNNYHVAIESFKSNFLLGTGIGSHPIAFEKFSLAKDIKVFGLNLNSADANSMLLRLISETGLFGVLIMFYIIIKFYVKRDEKNDTYHWLVSNGILIMILLNLFRQGHYFLNGFPFFVLLYIYNSISYNKLLENKGMITDVSKA